MATKDWEELEWNNSLSEGGRMWGNNKKGGMIFISKSAYGNDWRFGGTNKRGYFKEKRFNTKEQALSYAESYMRTH